MGVELVPLVGEEEDLRLVVGDTGGREGEREGWEREGGVHVFICRDHLGMHIDLLAANRDASQLQEGSCNYYAHVHVHCTYTVWALQ